MKGLIIFAPNECALDDLADRIRREAWPQPSMHSINGRHTPQFRIGQGWLGEAVLSRLEHEKIVTTKEDVCWATVLPPGAKYAPHNHTGHATVAVWCLVGSGALHLEPDVVVPDRAGQLVVFAGRRLHWVPQVEHERITVAVNLGWTPSDRRTEKW